jgi:CPA2 family monovalent cation:H+ antiporter-2
MGATPFAVAYSPQLADAALRLPLLRRLKTRDLPWLRDDAFAAKKLQDHMIIVGFGFNGQNVARAAKVAGVPYAIIEMNPETVRKEKATGEPICYGDAVHDAVLHRAFISTARVIVVVISDPLATRRIIAVARRLNPKLYIIARTRFLKEMNSLYELGADEVIPEEFETSVEIFSRVLAKYLIPKDEIDHFIAETRAAGYQMFRDRTQEPLSLPDLRFHLPDFEVGTIRVKEGSSIAGQSLSEIELRNRYGVTLVAVRRGPQVLANPDGRMRVLPNDILIIFGSPGDIAHLSETAQGG